MVMEKIQELVLKLIHSLKNSLIEHCGDNLVSLVVFGSLARGDFGLNSDIDLLLIFRQFLDSYSEKPLVVLPADPNGIAGEFSCKKSQGSLRLTKQIRPSASLRARTRFFLEIEKDIETEKMDIFKTTGYYPHFSPILRTMDEARKFSRIYLDMTEHVLVIYDEEQFFMQILKDMRNFLSKINAQKKWIGKKWYWVFAPDVEIGEVLPDG